MLTPSSPATATVTPDDNGGLTVSVVVPTYEGVARFVLQVERDGDGDWRVHLPDSGEFEESAGIVYLGAPDEPSCPGHDDDEDCEDDPQGPLWIVPQLQARGHLMSEFQITIDSELPPVTIDSTEVGNIMYHTAAAMQTTAESLLAAIVAASAAFDSDFESNDRRALVSELDHLASAAADLRTAALQSKRLASKADLAQLGELFTVPALLRTLGEGVSINDLMGAIRKHRDFAFGAVFTREDFPGGVIPEGFDGKYISDTLVERGGLYIAEEA